MIRFSGLVLLILLFSLKTEAQHLKKTLFEPKDGQKPTYEEVRKRWMDWSSNTDNLKKKGWKSFARWNWLTQSRKMTDETMRSYHHTLSEAQQLRRVQSRNARTLSAGWSPIGPLDMPDAYDPTSGHGMGRVNCIAFHPTDAQTLYAGSSGGGIWKTTDKGKNWTPVNEGLPNLRISSIAVDPTDPDILYAATGDFGYAPMAALLQDNGRSDITGFGVYKSTDAGVNWEPTGLSYEQEDFQFSLISTILINPENTQQLLAGGYEGFWLSDDGGKTWEPNGRFGIDMIWDIKTVPGSPQTLFAASGFFGFTEFGEARVMKSEDFGRTWEDLELGFLPTREVQRIELAVSPADPNYVYALTCGMDEGFYALYRSTDAGETWEERSSLENGALNILGWINGDPEFEQGGQGTYDLTLVCDKNDPERVYTGGVNMWGSEDGGQTFDLVSFWMKIFGESLHADQHSASVNPLDGTYYITNDGGVYFTDSIAIGSVSGIEDCVDLLTGEVEPGCYELPTEWTNISGGLGITEFYRIGLSKNNSDYIIGGTQDNGTFSTNGNYWMSVFGGDGMEAMIDHEDPEKVWCTTYNGFFFRSEDGGQTWDQDITAPIFAESEQGVWVTPFVMHPNTSDTIYTGFSNVWMSPNGGTDWEAVSDFPKIPGAPISEPIWDMAIAPSKPDQLIIATQNFSFAGFDTKVRITRDGGKRWEDISAGLPTNLFITDITIDDKKPHHFWVSVGGFENGEKVYESLDSGITWQNISEGLPNVPVNTVVHQPNTKNNLLYAGTDIGVYYRTELTDGWLPLNENLPTVIINELELHPVSGKIYAATYGRGVWMADMLEDDEDNDEQAVTGVEDFFISEDAKVFPNPSADGNFTLQFSSERNTDAHFMITDASGRQIMHRQHHISAGSNRIEIDLPESFKGMAFLRIFEGKKSRVIKLIRL